VRFTEIVGMIAACDRSIHDISRVELDHHSKLPRFNMPLDWGRILACGWPGPRYNAAGKVWCLIRSSTVMMRPCLIFPE
jgi:hypothetical protein